MEITQTNTRSIPNLNKSICFPLFGPTKDRSIDLYVEKIEEFERRTEKSLIELLSGMDIKAQVKTDPYSLPYTEEIKVTIGGESYMNGPYEVARVFRKIVKEILNKEVGKLRFYFWINIITEIPEGVTGLNALSHSFGKIEYCFRYRD